MLVFCFVIIIYKVFFVGMCQSQKWMMSVMISAYELNVDNWYQNKHLIFDKHEKYTGTETKQMYELI